MVNELAQRLRDMVDAHLQQQKKMYPARASEGEFTQQRLAQDLKLDPGTVSKYLKGRLQPSTTFTRKLIKHIHGSDPATIARIEKELDGLKRVQSKAPSLEFTEYTPSAVAIDFPPFFQVKEDGSKSGFVYTILKRLFALANKTIDDREVKQASVSDALSFVSNPQSPYNLVLGMAETIPRSIIIHTFHTPATVTLNVVAPLHGLAKVSNKSNANVPNRSELDHIRQEFLAQKHTNARFLAVNKEFGHTHLVEILKVPEEYVVVIESFEPRQIAMKLRELEEDGPRLFAADELTCLQVARELNSTTSQKRGGSIQYGMLFPLATLAAAHCYEFSKIPTYKVGLFSVARQLDKIIEVLERSLNALFTNERFFVAFEYKNLVDQLTSQLVEGITGLPPMARKYLAESHLAAQEHFQFPWNSQEFVKALSARVARQMLRLNTQLIESEDDLNLRWKPILEQVREQLGPLRPEYRDLRFDQASIRCRVFPPFIINEPKGGSDDIDSSADTMLDSGNAGNGPARISDWSIFGPVLSEVADLLNFEDLNISADSDETGHHCDFTVGMFDVIRRALDMHFFRFPVHLHMNALYLPELGEVESIRPFFAASAGLHRAAPGDPAKSSASPPVIPIVLRYTGAHYLCWDWGTPKIEFVDYDPKRFPFEKQLVMFYSKFSELASGHAPGKPIPIILSDELTCLGLLQNFKKRGLRLLFENIVDNQNENRSNFFYSVAVQKSIDDRWWRITQEVFPAAIAKSQRQLVTELRTLEKKLASIAHVMFPDEDSKRAKKWARRVLCQDLVDKSAARWNNSLLHEAWQPILSEAFS